jgi:hypothetical protein
VRFLWAKKPNAKDIHKEMFPVYGGKCLSRKAVHSWVEKSSQARSKVADAARPGRLVEWKEDKDGERSNCTTLFPWFNIQHNA